MRPLRVLCVDDDEDDFLITRDLLEEIHGATITVEWEGSDERALAVLLENRHDVCLVDYRLGARTGLELVQAAMDAGCDMPMIMLTGKGDRTVDVKAAKIGIAEYLVKGEITSATLDRAIRYAVENHRVLRALRASEERFALAVRGANDGIWDWDLETGAVYYSPRWCEMLGYAEDEVGSGPEAWLNRVHPEDAAHVRDELNAHLGGRIGHFEVEHRVLHADGSYRWMLTRGIAVRDAHGKASRVAGSQADITPRKAAEERLLHDALHDALTGLANRALFRDRLEHCLRRGHRDPGHACAVLFLDIDRFKVVNDGLGHALGDRLLIAVARRLESCLRPADTVARLGGDEFTVLVEDVTGPAEAVQVAERIQDVLAGGFHMNGRRLFVTASIGIAMSAPGSRPDDLIRDADTAMYRAKALGKARHVVFDAEMRLRAVARLDLEAALRQALDEGRLALHYQPIVEIRSGRIAGFEALTRWVGPAGVMISPAEFIPLAEETDLIVPLGRWVIEEACAQLARWRRDGLASAEQVMSVNVSGRQFSSDLGPVVEWALEAAGLPGSALTLELTESVIMDDPEAVRALIAHLRARLGVRADIDDFGTGYSSLAFLHRFPGSRLKIDRSFIAGLGTQAESAAMVRAIVALAHSLGLEVVAEGVETDAQLEAVARLGCEYAQGFLYGAPVASAVIEDLLARSVPGAMPLSRL